jgi:hypothetical protein
MEFAAGHLVAQLLGGHADPQDVPGAPSATVDFNVVLPEGRVVALEITAAADSDVVAETVAAFGREWKSPELRNNWMIGIGRRVGGDPVPIRDVMAGMMPILALFERNDESTVEVRYSPRYRTKPPEVSNHVHDAMIEMFDLGVEVARVWSSPDPGEDGQIYPTISAGVSSDSPRSTRWWLSALRRRSTSCALQPLTSGTCLCGWTTRTLMRSWRLRRSDRRRPQRSPPESTLFGSLARLAGLMACGSGDWNRPANGRSSLHPRRTRSSSDRQARLNRVAGPAKTQAPGPARSPHSFSATASRGDRAGASRLPLSGSRSFVGSPEPTRECC